MLDSFASAVFLVRVCFISAFGELGFKQFDAILRNFVPFSSWGLGFLTVVPGWVLFYFFVQFSEFSDEGFCLIFRRQQTPELICVEDLGANRTYMHTEHF